MQEGGSFTEEKIEYRDEEGNLLNEEQVKELEGKVSFSTRYETRTRLVDQAGNEIEEGPVVGGGDGSAGTKAEGVEQETPEVRGEGQANAVPPQAAVGNDGRNEKVAEERSKDGRAQPESEVGKETGHGEL